MNKILVEVSVGELLDKLTILEIKKDKIKDVKKLKFINLEYDSLKEQYDKNVKVAEKIKSLFSELKEINAKLWDIEDNKRQCEKDSKFDDHFILLSREIHSSGSVGLKRKGSSTLRINWIIIPFGVNSSRCRSTRPFQMACSEPTRIETSASRENLLGSSSLSDFSGLSISH